MKYDLEDRIKSFAKNIRDYVKQNNKSLINIDDYKQLIRASGSVGANFIEANESFSDKDFLFRLKISRKEIRECIYWLDLLGLSENKLTSEAIELKKILSSIILN